MVYVYVVRTKHAFTHAFPTHVHLPHSAPRFNRTHAAGVAVREALLVVAVRLVHQETAGCTPVVLCCVVVFWGGLGVGSALHQPPVSHCHSMPMSRTTSGGN